MDGEDRGTAVSVTANEIIAARNVGGLGAERPRVSASTKAMASGSVVIALMACLTAGAWFQEPPTIEKLFALAQDEGVFAYSRISPDGNFVAYSSERVHGEQLRDPATAVTVVDVRTKEMVFSEPGVDAYWSPDGAKMIYISRKAVPATVNIFHLATRTISRDVAPVALGDYNSWAVRDGRDLILTIQSFYYYLNGDKAELPASAVSSCAGIGIGERPLLSKDGRQISVFHEGTIVVRNLSDCEYVLDTGMEGAKADFSWDGRYVAFHAPKQSGTGYEIRVVDLRERTYRTITSLPGSSFFPSWTKSGELSFRYEGPEYRGFMLARNILSVRAHQLPGRPSAASLVGARWTRLFPGSPLPKQRINLVLVWGTWSAHSPEALRELQRVRDRLLTESVDIGVWTTTDPGSLPADIDRLVSAYKIELPQLSLAPGAFTLTEGHNQIPVVLLFSEGNLIDRRLGAQSSVELTSWLAAKGIELGH